MTRFLLALMAVGAIAVVPACQHVKDSPDDTIVPAVVPVVPNPEDPDEEPSAPAVSGDDDEEA